jgi:hypothetical protein
VGTDPGENIIAIFFLRGSSVAFPLMRTCFSQSGEGENAAKRYNGREWEEEKMNLR